jgi:hypothetical protein
MLLVLLSDHGSRCQARRSLRHETDAGPNNQWIGGASPGIGRRGYRRLRRSAKPLVDRAALVGLHMGERNVAKPRDRQDAHHRFTTESQTSTPVAVEHPCGGRREPCSAPQYDQTWALARDAGAGVNANSAVTRRAGLLVDVSTCKPLAPRHVRAMRGDPNDRGPSGTDSARGHSAAPARGTDHQGGPRSRATTPIPLTTSSARNVKPAISHRIRAMS